MTTYQLEYLRLMAKELIDDLDEFGDQLLQTNRDDVWQAMSDRERAEVNDAAMVVFGEWR